MILRLLGFMYAYVRKQGGAAAVPMGLTGYLSASHAEVRLRRCCRHPGKCRIRIANRTGDIIELRPVIRLRPAGHIEHANEPSPALNYFMLRNKHLEKTLGTPFVVDEGAARLGEGGGGKHNPRPRRSFILQMVDRDHLSGLRKQLLC